MTDRVPLYPGRVQLTPVSGQPNVYDMVRADQPTQEGDPLNKATFLQDTVAALFGKDGNAVPNDIFNLLSAAALQRTTSQPKYNEVTIDLSTAQVGDIIKLPFNGVMTPHLVLNVGNPNSALYDSSCNGVWMCMVDIYDNAVWDSGDSNAYGPSDVNTSFLPNTVLPLYSTAIQSGIVQAKIPYVNGTGKTGSVASGANGLSTKLFLLSGYEVGWSGTNFPVDGAVLSYFQDTQLQSSKRIAYFNGVASQWYLRSPIRQSNSAPFSVTSTGYYNNNSATNSYGIRPAFIMPTTFTTTVYTDDGGNVYDAQEYYDQQGLYDVLGNLLLTLPGVQIETGSYVGTGTYGKDNPNSLTFWFEPKLIAIQSQEYISQYYPPLFLISGVNDAYLSVGVTYSITTNWAGNSVTWYATTTSATVGASIQCNANGTYRYIAIG